MRVHVLTYHAMNVNGSVYADNDHVALAADLRCIHELGLPIVPLRAAVEWSLGARTLPGDAAVALSFDDGSWFDWYDIDHPTHGPQRGFAGILRDFRAETGAAVHATSFVIVSPEARETLDRTCMIGRGWWGHGWWREALAEGLIDIQSHSWDHNHATLPHTVQRHGERGTFRNIETWAEAEAEIRNANDWLDATLGARSERLLAYPYGESSAYLREHYLPEHRTQHRVLAAFGTRPAPLTPDADRWNLPRYVCGPDWRSTDALRELLRG